MSHKFSTLDGLRGVAAISVMVYHRRDWFGNNEFLQHAYLAVDFFFLLSGFVIAHAYGNRLSGRVAMIRFVQERVIRLHPMLIAGACLSAFVALLEARQTGQTLPNGIIFTLSHSIPFPVLWGDYSAAFPWNIAIWSLFWELIANLLFAFLAPWLSKRTLFVIVISSIVTMLFVSVVSNGFHVGFARDINQFIWGFPRVCASFFFGIFIYKNHTIKVSVRPYLGLGCAAALLITFGWNSSSPLTAGIYDPVIAYVIYPLLLVVAASAKPRMPRLTATLGAISYPLYIIHEPMLKVVSGIFAVVGISNGRPDPVEACFRFCAVAGIAFGVLKIYDEPVRKWLRTIFQQKALK